MSMNRSRPFPAHEPASALNEALEGARVRHPGDPDQCYTDGKFATGNAAAMTHGGHSRVSNVRERDPEALTARERPAEMGRSAVLSMLLAHVRSGRGIAKRPTRRMFVVQ